MTGASVPNRARAHRVAFVAQDAYPYESPTELYASFSYAVRKLEASVRSDPTLESCETTLIDLHTTEPEAFFEAIREYRPTIVAFSAYIWSVGTFLQIAKRIKEHDPDVLVIMGGPSARASLLSLAPYRGLVQYLDAVVPGEGESVIRALLKTDVREWRSIPGLLIPHSLGLRVTGESERIVLDEFPSPYQLGIVPKERVGYVETFRGCPMSCAFCQWGDARSDRVHGVEYLATHLRGLAEAKAKEVFFLDAAFNLSPRAHRNLMAAEREVGVLRTLDIHGHLYPTHVNESFLELLDRARKVRVMFGIQSFDREVLKGMSRPFDHDRFLEVVRDLRGRVPIEIEIIMGLPGDNARAYRQTVEKALEIADTVRVFFPLVLPDALLERAESLGIAFDPVTFRLIESRDWKRAELMAEWENTIAFAQTMPRHVVNETMVAFTTKRGAALSPHKSLNDEAIAPLRAALATVGGSLEAAYYGDRSGFVLAVAHNAGRVELEVDVARNGQASFVSRDGVAYSHRGSLESAMVPAVRSLIDQIHDATKQLLAR